MNENRNPVPQGVYNCKLVGVSRSSKSNHVNHFIISLRLLPTECGVDNPCEYFAELPLVYTSGVEFNFYNREKKCNDRRKCTTADTAAAIKYARKCIPAWAEFCDALPDGSSYADAFAWFDGDNLDVIVKAAIKEPREYNGKLYYEATAYEWRGGKSAIDDADDFNATFGKSLKAAGVKVGGGSNASNASHPKQPKAPEKPAPKAPSPSGKVYTSEDSWNAYEGGECIKSDPSGAKYWGEVEKIVGKPASDYESFTSEDWRKCVEQFAMPF